MAVNTNTTTSIKQASTVQGAKCEATQKNMQRLCQLAGCGDDVKMEKVMLPLAHGDKDDVLFVGLNGADFYFRRGRTATMPEPVAQILRNVGVIR